MRILARRPVPVNVNGERVQLVIGQEFDLPEDIALALVRGMAASIIPDGMAPVTPTTPAPAPAPVPPPPPSAGKPSRRSKR